MEIFLQARRLGDVLRDAVLLYANNFAHVFTIAAVAGVAQALVGTILGLVFREAFTYVNQNRANPTQAVPPEISQQILLAFVLFVAALTVISAIMTGALTYAISMYFVRKRMPGVGESYGAALRNVLPLVTVALILGVVVLSLSFTIVGIPLAAYLGIRWLFSCQAVVMEGQGVLGALGRSATLVRDNWTRVFGIMLATGVLAFMVGFPLLLIPLIGQMTVSLLVWPWVIIAGILLYFDLRVRKERLTETDLAGEMGREG